MVSGALPTTLPALAMMSTVPALSTEIIALPSLCVSMEATLGSETLHLTFFTPVTTAGSLKSCWPSNAEYILSKWISTSASVDALSLLPDPSPAPEHAYRADARTEMHVAASGRHIEKRII